MRRLDAHAGDTPTCVLFRAQEAPTSAFTAVSTLGENSWSSTITTSCSMPTAATAAVAPTDVASGAAVIISAGNITHATTSATGPTDGRVNNHVVATRPWPDMTTRHRHALSTHVVTSTVTRPSCSTPTAGTPILVTKNATAATAAVGPTGVGAVVAVIVSAAIPPFHCSTNYRWLPVFRRQPAAPSFATRAKATPARKITGE